MDFIYFTEFQHYVTACYLISILGVVGLTVYVVMQSKKQKTRLKTLEAKLGK